MLLLAGEASGDAYGARVAVALRARLPDLRLVGTGGPEMREAGVDLLAELDELAVMGFAEVVPRLPFFRRLERRVRERIAEPDVVGVVLVDFPGFNLRAARAAHRMGRPVLYYVAPKVWAWRPGRARALSEVVDRLAVVLPFEVDRLAELGVRATFVGHPLLDPGPEIADRPSFCARWGLDARRPILAVLPGSRDQEVGRHLRVFLDAAERVSAARPELVAVTSRAPSVSSEPFQGVSPVVVGDTRALLRHARLALIASGTATLEAVMEGTPAVVAYRTSALTWALARWLVDLEHVSLPNLIAGRRIVPELLQGEAAPSPLAEALLPLVDEGPERADQIAGASQVRAALGEPGAAERVADMALELMGGAG